MICGWAMLIWVGGADGKALSGVVRAKNVVYSCPVFGVGRLQCGVVFG